MNYGLKNIMKYMDGLSSNNIKFLKSIDIEEGSGKFKQYDDDSFCGMINTEDFSNVTIEILIAKDNYTRGYYLKFAINVYDVNDDEIYSELFDKDIESFNNKYYSNLINNINKSLDLIRSNVNNLNTDNFINMSEKIMKSFKKFN